jgi:hypothetical protein
MTQGGAAIPVITVSRSVEAGPALRVVVVSDGRPTEGGPARPVVEVADGRPVLGNVPLPIVVATGVQATQVLAGPAQPVVVVSGYLPTAVGARILATSPIAYWPQDEASGTVITDRSGNARNGVYTAVTIGAAGIGDGHTAASYDGATSFGNIFSASLAAAFSGAEGTIGCWCKVANAGVWTDAVARRIMYLAVDANNRVSLVKPVASNEIDWLYVAGGTTKQAGVTTFSPTTFFHLALSWSKSADQVKFYVNGAQSGATVTGLGVFAGTLAAATTLLGAISTAPANVWSGSLAHAAIWARALSAAEVASLAVI